MSQGKVLVSPDFSSQMDIELPAMTLLPSIHPLNEFRGTPRACGRDYGHSQAEAIGAFLAMEVPPSGQRLLYASRCWKRLAEWEQAVVEFVRGMAEGSKRPVEEIVLLLLHEEIFHTKSSIGMACTAVGAAAKGTRDGSPVIGQNWDWSERLYPWSNLVRLRSDAMPGTITYSYPGLWASAGINEHGLSLVWTGAGYFPPVRPKVGVPTYALIAGILGSRTCREAIALMKRTPNAGCFIFFLADKEGEVWVIEGVPGRIEAIQCADVICRANHYESPGICRQAKQRVPPGSIRANTRARRQRMGKLLEEQCGRIDADVVQTLLRDHGAEPGLDICQHPVRGRPALTLDSFFALPSKKELWIARGSPCRHSYECYHP